MMNQRPPSPQRRVRPAPGGFTLIELMISITIGLIILAAMTTLFVNNSRTQAEIEKANRQVENGRYAMQLVSTDARHAGFYQQFDPRQMTTPTTLPDICSVTLADLSAALPLGVQGVDNASTITCLPDLKTGTDVLVVRRVETCVPGTLTCDAASAGGVFLQPSQCMGAAELGSSNLADHFVLDSVVTNLNRTTRACVSTTRAPFYRYQTYIYYVASYNNLNDGIPTLKKAMLTGTSTSVALTIFPMVEGIEDMQLSYGLDKLPATPDSIVDQWSTAPATSDDWRTVVGLKVNILARNIEPTVGYVNAKSYAMGIDSAGTLQMVTPTDTRFKRHVYSSTVTLSNLSGRRIP